MKKYLTHSFRFLLIIFCALLAAVMAHRGDRYRHQLTEIYKGALLGTVQETDEIRRTLEKALLSAPAARNAYLNLAVRDAGQMRSRLALMPLSHPDTMKAIRLTNQLSAYAGTLAEEKDLSQEDIRQLSLLIRACRDYCTLLDQSGETLSGTWLKETAFYPEENGEALDDSMLYPTLIYDGPFSDAVREKALPLQDLPEITWDEAARIAGSFIGENRVKSYSHGADVLGPTPCHGISLNLGDIALEAAVTRQGGKVLWIACNGGPFQPETTVEICREAALRFLEKQGYDRMEATGFQVYEGVAVLSFAPVQGNVLLYPDMVKVQLRMDTAEVIGLEAKDYLQNHRSRGLLQPKLTETQARKQISPLLQIEESRLCLIPTETEEKLCYEFRCLYQDGEYLIYISADDGTQADLKQVVESSAGPSTV